MIIRVIALADQNRVRIQLVLIKRCKDVEEKRTMSFWCSVFCIIKVESQLIIKKIRFKEVSLVKRGCWAKEISKIAEMSSKNIIGAIKKAALLR